MNGNIRDSYQIFMEKFNIDIKDFINFGIQESISIEMSIARTEWEKLKDKIIKGNDDTSIRGYGRDAKGTELYMDLYRELFGHNRFVKDKTNNDKPTRLLEKCTGFKRNETTSSNFIQIRNYQVSHIFGHTKNPYAFTAPWNIVYIPKIIDPFTGHESKGKLTNEFTKTFRQHYFNNYREYILEYNEIMDSLQPRILEYLENKFKLDEESNIITKFKKQVLFDFSSIELS